MALALQVNLKLFAPEPNRQRTVLLFVIRDKSKTPLSKLVEVLSEDVHKMWDTISKPPQYVDSKIDDFFEVGAKQSQHTSTGVLYWPGRPQLLLTAQQLGRYPPGSCTKNSDKLLAASCWLVGSGGSTALSAVTCWPC